MFSATSLLPTAWQQDVNRRRQVTLTICGIGLRYLLNFKLKMTVLPLMNYSRVQVKYFLVLKVAILILSVKTGVRFFGRVLTVLILIHRPRLKYSKLNIPRGYLNQNRDLICRMRLSTH